MSFMNGNIPNLKNSQSIGQTEIQNVKQNMNYAASQNMVLGANLASNTSNAASQGNMTNFAPSLNSSTSVGSIELQNAKNKMQNSVYNKGMF